MRILRTARDILRANMRPYVIISIGIYGICLLGFALASVFPGLRAARLESMEDDGTITLVTSLLDNVWLFALVILGVNALTVGALSILVPSLVVPFAGLAVIAYRSFAIGATLLPADTNGWIVLIPHSLTWVIEMQAYVLLALGAHLLGKAWLRPSTVNAPNRRAGYLHGLRTIGHLAVPALALLVIGAVYEAFSLLYLVPLMIT